MQHYDDTQQREDELQRKAQAIAERCMSRDSRISLVPETPIEDLTEEELKTLVEKEFNDYGLNYILIENFDRYIKDKQINLNLSTRQPVRDIAEVQKVLESQLENYIRDLKSDCESCKAKMYEYLRAYQDKQKRKKEGNPFSN